MMTSLFSQFSISDLYEAKHIDVRNFVKQFDYQKIESTSEEELFKEVETIMKVNVPVLFENEISVSPGQQTIIDYQGPHDFRPVKAAAIQFQFHIPYSGDRKFFDAKPIRMFETSYPAAEILENELMILEQEVLAKGREQCFMNFKKNCRASTAG